MNENASMADRSRKGGPGDAGANAASPGPSAAPGPARRVRAVLLPMLIFAAIAGLFAFALTKGDPSKLPSALIGKAAPAIALPPLEGLVEAGQPMPGFATSDLPPGQPVVINFWASWCTPCVDEHPLLVHLKQRTGVTIIGVNYKDQAANARRFLSRYGNPFTRVGTDGNGRAAIEWGVYGMPESFILDGRGVIVHKQVGPFTAETLEKHIIPLIEQLKRSG